MDKSLKLTPMTMSGTLVSIPLSNQCVSDSAGQLNSMFGRTMKMRVRNANADDAAALREMWCRFMTELHAGSHPSVQDADAWGTRLQSQLRREQVVVVDDGQSLRSFAGFIQHSDRAFVPASVALLVPVRNSCISQTGDCNGAPPSHYATGYGVRMRTPLDKHGRLEYACPTMP